MDTYTHHDATGGDNNMGRYTARGLTGYYTMEPAPRANPLGLLDGAWVIKYHSLRHIPGYGVKGTVVARFPSDGRDMAEAWLAVRHYHHPNQTCYVCYPTTKQQEVK